MVDAHNAFDDVPVEWTDVVPPETAPAPPPVTDWAAEDPSEPAAHPILHYERNAEGRHAVHENTQGTAFFVANFGLFITARHNVERDLAYAVNRLRSGPAASVEVLPLRDVPGTKRRALARHDTLDLAVGLVRQPSIRPPVVRLSAAEAPSTDTVLTYGYPATQIQKIPRGEGSFDLRLNWHPVLRKGVVEYFTDAWEGSMQARGMPGYMHTAEVLSGASGGPLFHGARNAVCGVNSTSFGRAIDGANTSFSVDIRPLLDWPIWFLGGRTLRVLSLLPGEPVRIVD